MSSDGRKRAPQHAPNTPTTATKKKKTKKVQRPFNLHPTTALLLEGLRKAHTGKRILLTSKALFKTNRIPEGEENYLCQYHIYEVNGDGKTARCLTLTLATFLSFKMPNSNFGYFFVFQNG